jgi:hypothetical protein
MTVHHDHGRSTTVVTGDREGPATALIVVLALLLVAFLVWFFAFSGVVFDRGSTTGPGGSTTTNTNVDNGNTSGNTGGTTSTAPNPAPS